VKAGRVALVVASVLGACRGGSGGTPSTPTGPVVTLPAPRTTGSVSVEEAIARRRSSRSFGERALRPDELSQLLWAAQGITDAERGYRAAPSAGALFPLELYPITAEAVFHYDPGRHALTRVREGDARAALANAALDQDAVRAAALDLVVCAVPSRTRAKYGDRAERFVSMEAGHAAENVLLEATALGLSAVPVGALDGPAAVRLVGAGEGSTCLYVVAVGAAP
jgi:SagB-type dehydrogenase family enzyme